MKTYRILHIPTGEFFDYEATKVDNFIVAGEACLAIDVHTDVIPCPIKQCKKCHWTVAYYKAHKLEYLIEEIK